MLNFGKLCISRGLCSIRDHPYTTLAIFSNFWPLSSPNCRHRLWTGPNLNHVDGNWYQFSTFINRHLSRNLGLLTQRSIHKLRRGEQDIEMFIDCTHRLPLMINFRKLVSQKRPQKNWMLIVKKGQTMYSLGHKKCYNVN